MLLDDILDRIDRLTCLPQVVKNLLPEHLSQLEPDDLEAYADGPLALIEEWIEPLARPKDEGGSYHFYQVSIALEDVKDLKLLAQAYQLKLKEEVDPWDLWLDWVWKTQMNSRVCLHAVAGFWAWAFVWNQGDLTENVLSIQADCYRLLGWPPLTVRLLEERYGLSPAHYGTQAALSSALGRSILADCHPSTQANVLMTLVQALRIVDGRGTRDAAMLLETWLGLRPEHYRDKQGKPTPQYLQAALQTSPLKHVEAPITWANVLISLAGALRFVDGRGEQDAAMLLETWLGLSPEYYRDKQGEPTRQYLQAALQTSPLKEVDSLGTWANVLNSLANALRFVDGRGARDAVVLLESWLQLTPDDYRDHATLRKALQASPLQEVGAPITWANVLFSLADTLHLVDGRGDRDAAVLLESWLQLTPDDYRDHTTLRKVLQASPLQEVDDPVTWVNVLNSLTNALRFVDGRGPRDAAVLLESWLQLTSDDYRDHATLRKVLQASPLQKVSDPITWANVLRLLADVLPFVDGRGNRNAAVLLESWLQLTPDDYRDHATLQEALQTSPLQKVSDPITWANVLNSLANVLPFVDGRGNRNAAVLLESWLQLTPDDYCDQAALREALQTSPLQKVSDPITWANVLKSLAEALRLIDGRGAREAAVLLETWLGLRPEHYRDKQEEPTPQYLQAALQTSPLKAVGSPVTWANVLMSLADALRFVDGRGARDAAVLLESWLGLRPEHYRDKQDEPTPQYLQAALQTSPLQEVGAPVIWANILVSLANALRFVDGRGAWDAAVLLESWLQLQPSDYRDHGALRAALQASPLKAVGDPVTWANVLVSLAQALRFVDGRGDRDAAVLLESWLQLQPSDYRDHGALRAALQASQLKAVGDPVTWANVLVSLAQALRFVDGRGDRDAVVLWQAALVDEAGNDVSLWELRERGRFVGMLVETQLAIAMSVLQLKEFDSDDAWRICDAMATWIDETRREKLPTSQARLDFLLRIRDLYPIFRRIGFAHITRASTAGDQARAAGCAARMFEWLELIENRSLIENLRPGQRPAGIDEHPELHPDQWDPERWPFANDSAWNQGRQLDWEATWDDDDPAPPGDAGDLGQQGSHWQYARLQSLMSRPLALQRRSSGPPPSQPTPPSRPLGRAKDAEEDTVGSPLPVSSVEIHDAATIALREQLWQLPSDLVTLLPAGCLWLRFLFDDAGRLWWWTVQRDKSDIKVLATGQSEPGAHQRLQLATEVFDLKVDALWELLRQRGAHGSGELIGGFPKQKVLDLLQWAAAPASLEEQSPPGGWPQWRQTVQGVLDQLRGTRWCELWQQLLELVCAAAGHPVAEAARMKDLPIDPAEAIAQLEFRQPLVDISQVILEMQLPSDRVSKLSMNWLEAATAAHVQALTQELDLSSLWDQLTPEVWRETDILYQAQDSLWPYPLGLLPFGPEEYPPGDLEQPPLTFGDRVASLSCTVSLGLRHFAADRSKRSNEQETSHQSRVLSAQWLKEEDRKQMFGLGALEACLRKVAKSRDALIYSLGDHPGASLEHVDAALLHDTLSFEAAVLGGHGDPDQLGVEMQDAVWSGLLGDELAGQDLLFLVSCVVGRLNQAVGVALDVRGLYTRLAACRAVIAARWPISDVEAAIFTVEFMMGYLSALKAAKTRGEPAVAEFVRARILNDVRRRLTRPTAERPPMVTRHLAHAFELYGLG